MGPVIFSLISKSNSPPPPPSRLTGDGTKFQGRDLISSLSLSLSLISLMIGYLHAQNTFHGQKCLAYMVDNFHKCAKWGKRVNPMHYNTHHREMNIQACYYCGLARLRKLAFSQISWNIGKDLSLFDDCFCRNIPRIDFHLPMMQQGIRERKNLLCLENKCSSSPNFGLSVDNSSLVLFEQGV